MGEIEKALGEAEAAEEEVQAREPLKDDLYKHRTEEGKYLRISRVFVNKVQVKYRTKKKVADQDGKPLNHDSGSDSFEKTELNAHWEFVKNLSAK